MGEEYEVVEAHDEEHETHRISSPPKRISSEQPRNSQRKLIVLLICISLIFFTVSSFGSSNTPLNSGVSEGNSSPNNNNQDNKREGEESKDEKDNQRDSSSKQPIDREEPYEDSSEDIEDDDNEEKNDENMICDRGLVFASDSCQASCQMGYRVDLSDNLCKPMNSLRKQIKLRSIESLPKTTTTTIGESYSKIDQFFEVVMSKGQMRKENKQGVNGFFFFNGNKNGGFNYLNDAFGNQKGKGIGKLREIIENLDGFLVSLSSDDGLFMKNEAILIDIISKTIDANPGIRNWYMCGVFESGGYSALRYFLKFKQQMKGVIVMNPSFYLQNGPGENVMNTFSKNQSNLISKTVVIIQEYGLRNSYESEFIKTWRQGMVVTFTSNTTDQKEKVYLYFFKTLEQIISTSKKANSDEE